MNLPYKKTGKIKVISRAKDSAGNSQPLKHVWNPGGYVRNAVQGHSFFVLSSRSFEGSLIFKNRCLMCHSQGIVSSQKFHPKNWKKTFEKMKHFGAVLEPEEEKPLEEFLKIMTRLNPTSAKSTSYQTKKDLFSVDNPQIRSKVSEGQKIYDLNCSACHGEQGEGRRGPRLRGRLIPTELFVQAILKGKNLMPAFETSLNSDQVESLWQFLQRPLPLK
jgi:mono/diheme cytochrome c family protein